MTNAFQDAEQASLEHSPVVQDLSSFFLVSSGGAAREPAKVSDVTIDLSDGKQMLSNFSSIPQDIAFSSPAPGSHKPDMDRTGLTDSARPASALELRITALERVLPPSCRCVESKFSLIIDDLAGRASDVRRMGSVNFRVSLGNASRQNSHLSIDEKAQARTADVFRR